MYEAQCAEHHRQITVNSEPEKLCWKRDSHPAKVCERCGEWRQDKNWKEQEEKRQTKTETKRGQVSQR